MAIVPDRSTLRVVAPARIRYPHRNYAPADLSGQGRLPPVSPVAGNLVPAVKKQQGAVDLDRFNETRAVRLQPCPA